MMKVAAAEKTATRSIKQCTVLIYYYMMIPHLWFTDLTLKEDPYISAYTQIFNHQLLD